MMNFAGGIFGIVRGLLIAAIVVLNFTVPARAQFSDQATFVGSTTGSSNTYAATLPNVTSFNDILGVLIKIVPNFSNTGAASLNISSLGGISIEKPSAAGLVNLTGSPSELVSGQAAIVMYTTTGCTCFVLLSAINDSPTITAASLGNSTQSFSSPINLQINAAVSSNQLVLSVVGNNGSAASATNPILVAFRDVTIANGDPVIISLQSALGFTIGSGDTMGCQSGLMCRLRLYLGNNAGTLVLCAYNSNSGGTSIVGLNEANLQSNAGGTSGGNAAQALYCNGALSSEAVREIGYVDIQETVAGTWATGPTYVQLMGPGIKKAGDIVQVSYNSDNSATTAASNTPVVTTPSVKITPTSAANLILADARGVVVSAVSAGQGLVRIYRNIGGTAACTTAVGGQQNTTSGGGSSGSSVPTAVVGLDEPNTTSQLTYVICTAGNSGDGSVYCAQTVVNICTIMVQEIEARREPINDNELLRMIG